MGTAASLPDAPAYMLPGVRLFASGEYRGIPWKPIAVRMMAANARKLSALHVPPARPGHEDDEGWREWFEDRTDQPAAGWVNPHTVTATADPENPGEVILTGDVVNVPPEMAQKIASGEYATGSSEIYSDFLDDFGKSHGPTLRRFSYLGGDVPQVKRLGRLPTPVPMTEPVKFSERRERVRVRGKAVRRGAVVRFFAEASRMDRQSMCQAIQAAMPGLSQAFLDGLGDDAIAELAKNCPAPAQPPATDPNAAGPVSGQQMADANDANASPSMPDMVIPAPASGYADDPNNPTPTATPAPADATKGKTTDFAVGDGSPNQAGQEAAMNIKDPYSEMADDGMDGMAYADGQQSTGGDPAGDPANMSREEVIKNLVAMGQDEGTLTGMSDDDLKGLYAQLKGGGQQMADDGSGGAGGGAMPREDMMNALVSAGQDPQALSGMSDDDLSKLHGQILGGSATAPAAGSSMADKPMPNAPVTRCAEPAKKPGQQQPAKPTADPQAAALIRKLNEHVAFSEKANAKLRRDLDAAKRQKIDLFCEGLKKSGRYLPADIATLIRPVLLPLDDVHSVHRFTEAGKTRLLTALERKMAEIEGARRPNAVIRFGEKVPEDKATQDDADLAAVQRFAETQREALRRAGKSPEQFVTRFSETQKKNPEEARKFVASLPAEYRN